MSVNVSAFQLQLRRALPLVVAGLRCAAPGQARPDSPSGEREALLRSLAPSAAELRTIRNLAIQNRDAACLVNSVLSRADSALRIDPRPLSHLNTAGRLETDPVRLRSESSLGDMRSITNLWFAYLISGRPDYLRQLQKYFVAWSSTYLVTGNPIDETNLEPVIRAFPVAASKGLQPADSVRGIRWLRSLAEAYLGSADTRRFKADNWESHRVKLLTITGMALNDQVIVDSARSRIRRQISANLLPDGSSTDFHERDAVFYHRFTLEPLLTSAIALSRAGDDFYNYESPTGSSLRRSVRFLADFASGKRTHLEFRHTAARIDSIRAASGLLEYQPGEPFNPAYARWAMERAAFFEPRYISIAANLYPRACHHFSSIPLLIAGARWSDSSKHLP